MTSSSSITSSSAATASSTITEQIGHTPLIQLNSFSTKNVKLYAKLEWYNPFGSIKDRAAYWMIKDAEAKGILKKDKSIIIEPTSGNTGIALTGIATSLGYKVEIVIPEKVSEETKKILRSLGATLHETSDDLCPRVGELRRRGDAIVADNGREWDIDGKTRGGCGTIDARVDLRRTIAIVVNAGGGRAETRAPINWIVAEGARIDSFQ